MSLIPIARPVQPLRGNYAAQVFAEAESLCCDHRSPLSAAARLQLRGLLALKSGQLQFGLTCLERAVESSPANSAIAADHANALALTGQHAEAIEAARRALRLEDNT